MLTYVTGSLFESPAHTLVNTVNLVGVMGKGVAAEFKRIYPDMFKEYRSLCESGTLNIGSLHLYRTPHKNILNFPTKKHWRHPSRLEYVEKGLQSFVGNYERMRVRSISFPALGCGNGGLDFATQVQPLMERFLSDIPIPVYVHLPRHRVHRPEHRDPAAISEWLRSSPTDLPFDEVWEDLRGIFAQPTVLKTLTERSELVASFLSDVDDEGIRVRTPGKTVTLRRDDFLYVWRQLREAGFITPRSMPGHRERLASYAFPIMAKLAYVTPVTLGGTYDSFLSTPSVGLQIAPPRNRRMGRPEPVLALN